MHISEGVLSGSMLITGWTGTCAGVAYGLKHTDMDRITRTALLSSGFFLASLVNVKIGPGSTHLSFLAPMGLVLGPGVFPAMFVALLLQALLFHFGGLLVLGSNTFIMAGSSLCVYLVFGRFVRGDHGRMVVMIGSFLSGFLAVMLAACLSGAFLILSDAKFIKASQVLILAHLPLAFLEGLVTCFMIMWLRKSAPEFLL